MNSNLFHRLMIHYGELSTKGRNRDQFIRRLEHNIRHALKDFSISKITSSHDHIYIDFVKEEGDKIIKRLQDVSGIHAISPVIKIASDLDSIKKMALEVALDSQASTFKVQTKRLDKAYPIHSDNINRSVGGFILENSSLTVDVHSPDFIVRIQILNDGALVLGKSFAGAGGYPLGTGGKALLLLSGGIDSPVAAYSLIRRGIEVECLHFAAPPYTQVGVIDKLEDLLRVLTRYQSKIKLYIVPFTNLQLSIYKYSSEGYPITVMRRMMLRIAERFAAHKRISALATGESLGQVASQTLKSLYVINNVTTMPIIRPLAVMDKLQIIEVAKKIGTYEISIRPFEDCCTIFAPKNPKTMPHMYEVRSIEEKWDFKAEIDEIMKSITVKEITEKSQLDAIF
ncbi:MAG: tRNA 4-thiouridine(8) synthase ThiI [Bacilli bacterium]|jgi:thiamine biosynthesis protein ThiI|nr:tRNA 4-thiouridine(8) synthase ThiI [Bacilli bacterium]MCH4235341.1 tRNA 4-thiouridine(8) synthase ThiI [Bacilli bacterium]